MEERRTSAYRSRTAPVSGTRPTVAVLSRDPAFPILDTWFRVVSFAPYPDQVPRAVQAAPSLIIDSVSLAPTETLLLFAAVLVVSLPVAIRLDPDRLAVLRLATGVEPARALLAASLPAAVLAQIVLALPSVRIPMRCGLPLIPPPHLRAAHLRLLALAAERDHATVELAADLWERDRATLYRDPAFRDLHRLLQPRQRIRWTHLWSQVYQALDRDPAG